MLTIFTTPKPFVGHDNIIQVNAIRSWTLLKPECEIILMGNDEGTDKIAAELGVRHYPKIEYSEYGTPLLNSLFSQAQEVSARQILCYINADIILMSEFLPMVQRIVDMRNTPNLLVVGQRWDFNVDKLIQFEDPKWENRLRTAIHEKGKLHPKTGVDYFIFNKGLYHRIPPLAVGRTAWDHWLIYQARYQKAEVIDASDVITAVHQNHGYSHVPDGEAGAWKGREALKNQELVGYLPSLVSLEHATVILTSDCVEKDAPNKPLLAKLKTTFIFERRLRLVHWLIQKSYTFIVRCKMKITLRK